MCQLPEAVTKSLSHNTFKKKLKEHYFDLQNV